MTAYVSSEEIKTYLGIPAEDTSQDARLAVLVVAVSRAIDSYCRRRFDVRTETRVYRDPCHSDTLWLDDDLHSLTSIVNGDDRSIPVDRTILYPTIGPPYRWICLTHGERFLQTRDQPGIRVTGSWGYVTPTSQELVRQAARIWVTQLHAQAADVGVVSKTLGDFSVAYKEAVTAQPDMSGHVTVRPPLEVALLLDVLRRRDIRATG